MSLICHLPECSAGGGQKDSLPRDASTMARFASFINSFVRYTFSAALGIEGFVVNRGKEIPVLMELMLKESDNEQEMGRCMTCQMVRN